VDACHKTSKYAGMQMNISAMDGEKSILSLATLNRQCLAGKDAEN